MHLGLKTGPLCPMLYTTLKEPCSYQSSRWPLYLGFLISSGSKKKEPGYVCSSEAKASLRLKILMTSGSKKGTQIYFSFVSKVPANEPTPGSLPGLLWRGRPVYRAFCISQKTSSFGFPNKGALPQGPLHGIPGREMPHH